MASDASLITLQVGDMRRVIESIGRLVHVAVALEASGVLVERHIEMMALDAGVITAQFLDESFMREENGPAIAIAVDHHDRHTLIPG